MSFESPDFEDLLRSAQRRARLLPLMHKAVPLSDRAKRGLRQLGRAAALSLSSGNPTREVLRERVHGFLSHSAAASTGFGSLMEAIMSKGKGVAGPIAHEIAAHGLGLATIEAAVVAFWEGEDPHGTGALDEDAENDLDEPSDEPEGGEPASPDFSRFWSP